MQIISLNIFGNWAWPYSNLCLASFTKETNTKEILLRLTAMDSSCPLCNKDIYTFASGNLLIVLLRVNFGIFIPLPLVIYIVDWLHLNWNKLPCSMWKNIITICRQIWFQGNKLVFLLLEIQREMIILQDLSKKVLLQSMKWKQCVWRMDLFGLKSQDYLAYALRAFSKCNQFVKGQSTFSAMLVFVLWIDRLSSHSNSSCVS